MVGCQRFPKALQQSWYPIKISLNHHFFGPRWWRYPLCPRHSTWTSSSWQLVWCWSRTWSPAQSTSTISNSLPARRSCANSFCTRIMWGWGKLTPQGTSVWVIYWVRIRLGFGLVVLGVVLMNLTAGAWWHAASMALDQDLRTHPINSGIFYVHPDSFPKNIQMWHFFDLKSSLSFSKPECWWTPHWHRLLKAPMFSFQRLSGSDPHVGVEMQSTGEALAAKNCSFFGEHEEHWDDHGQWRTGNQLVAFSGLGGTSEPQRQRCLGCKS